MGGFGTVYKGRDPFIKRAVAIKTCQSEEEEIKKRFFREAEFAGNLHHRNITTIYDFGVTDDGTPYIVQEFLTGDDLDKLARKSDPLPLRRKLEILADVCEGLGYAHAAGIIHRDIKPSNVRILEDGTVKIMDFGIAKSMVSQSTLTQTGITLGTASYLAPEQIRGEDLDPRTDIFSLGVLAYELVAGSKPFTGDHISTVLYKIMNEQPAAPSVQVPGLPRGLDALVLKALEKDRTRRYSSCGEMKADVVAVLGSLSDSAPTRARAAGRHGAHGRNPFRRIPDRRSSVARPRHAAHPVDPASPDAGRRRGRPPAHVRRLPGRRRRHGGPRGRTGPGAARLSRRRRRRPRRRQPRSGSTRTGRPRAPRRTRARSRPPRRRPRPSRPPHPPRPRRRPRRRRKPPPRRRAPPSRRFRRRPPSRRPCRSRRGP